MLVVLNHYLAFQYFAEEYYLFSEVRGHGGGGSALLGALGDLLMSPKAPGKPQLLLHSPRARSWGFLSQ